MKKINEESVCALADEWVRLKHIHAGLERPGEAVLILGNTIAPRVLMQMLDDIEFDTRESSHRREHPYRCDCCGNPIFGEHYTDDEVCQGSDAPGFFLCSRLSCHDIYFDKPVDERRAIFEAGRGKNSKTRA